jgi:UDP-glucose 4-epimerase
MNVAVTGCLGFIGSILSKMLLERGYGVYGCDWAFSKNQRHNMTGFTNTSFDEDVFVEEIIKKNIKVIFHLAATSLVGPSYENPIPYYDNNTGRTTAFLHKLLVSGWTGHIVFASTASVYGSSNNSTPFIENAETVPNNHYGQSKLFCEKIIHSCKINDITSTIFRFFNVVGSYKGLGEEYDDTHLLSKLCFSALHDHPFSLFGTGYPTRDGTCVRDYVHVVDVCEAQIFAAERLTGTNSIYNLGTSKGTSVQEMIDAFCKYTGKKISVNAVERRLGDPAYLVADSKKFTCTADFTYNHSSLKEMILSTWEYYNKRGLHGV